MRISGGGFTRRAPRIRDAWLPPVIGRDQTRDPIREVQDCPSDCQIQSHYPDARARIGRNRRREVGRRILVGKSRNVIDDTRRRDIV